MRLSASALVEELVDDGSFVAWCSGSRRALPQADPDMYAVDAHADDDAIVTGAASVDGHRVALAVGDFDVAGGTLGWRDADRLVSCVDLATARGLPLVSSPASGGIRLQEGTPAFLRMADIALALARHRSAGLVHVVYLRDPTMGGVLASWGSLGHVVAAQPGARIGLIGPRAHEVLSGHPLPDGVQRAAALYEDGLVDAVLDPGSLAGFVARVLRVVHPAVVDESFRCRPAEPSSPPAAAWEAVERSRRPERPGAAAIVARADDVVHLWGPPCGASHPGLIVALARFGTARCVVVGQDAGAQRVGSRLDPSSLGAARQAMALAGTLDLPVLCLVDTPGLSVSERAERQGSAQTVASCMTDLLTSPVPTVSFLLGQGAGAGALALFPADVVLCARYGWLAPLAPEGTAAVLRQGADSVPTIAEQQGITATALERAGYVDLIVDERPDATDESDGFIARAVEAIEWAVHEARHRSSAERLLGRRNRFGRAPVES